MRRLIIAFNFLILLNFAFISWPAFGQGAAATASSSEDDIIGGSVRDVSIVVGLGLFGAILGLSTLSFVDEPSENLKNIVTGAALGTIMGVGVVAWGQATRSQDLYLETARLYRRKDDNFSGRFSTTERIAWYNNRSARNIQQNQIITPWYIRHIFTF